MTAFGKNEIAQAWRRGAEFLGCDHAIMGGAMTWVSERHLVAAISNSGGFGVLACGAMPPDKLRDEIKATRQKTSRNFAVNLILMHPNLVELIDICGELKVKYVVFAGGLPTQTHIAQVKSHGIKVMGFAPTVMIGKKLVKMGVDALIIEGSEAGGHIGPVSTSVLAQEILPAISDVPIFVAGGIGRGEMIALYVQMGAAGVQLGTRFVCASESMAHQNFKQAFIRAEARDALASVQLDPRFPVIPVRAINNQASKLFMECQRDVIERFNRGVVEQKAAQLEIEHFWAGALRRAVVEGDVENGSLMAGQSVGMVKSIQPCADIIGELVAAAGLGK
ncbi:MAG: nitronate monooxygenase [Alphaproteobacteria bacterium]|nr:nitronate monooxygenase [Alphaproteobacteria bacterium]